MTELERTPQVWAELVGLRIVDPDGWREMASPSYDQPIDWVGFSNRIQRCTVTTLPGFIGWERIQASDTGLQLLADAWWLALSPITRAAVYRNQIAKWESR